MIFQFVFIASFFLLALEDWMHGEIANWKLWMFILFNIIMSFTANIPVPIAYTIFVLLIILACNYLLKMGGADTVAYAGISAIFPQLFLTVFLSSLIAGQVAIRFSNKKQIRFLPVILIALLICYALQIVTLN